VRYCAPSADPDNGLGVRDELSLGGISRAEGDGLDLVAELEVEANGEPDDTLDGPAKGRPELLELELELELGPEGPPNWLESLASGDLVAGRDVGIESCEGLGTALDPVARPGGRHT
jgi:hypothetical protein